MDLKYTEVSKQIGLAASHIEFDSQGDSIFIDCYHLSCLRNATSQNYYFLTFYTNLCGQLLFFTRCMIQNVAET